jgi:hypothetical protein
MITEIMRQIETALRSDKAIVFLGWADGQVESV